MLLLYANIATLGHLPLRILVEDRCDLPIVNSSGQNKTKRNLFGSPLHLCMVHGTGLANVGFTNHAPFLGQGIGREEGDAKLRVGSCVGS